MDFGGVYCDVFYFVFVDFYDFIIGLFVVLFEIVDVFLLVEFELVVIFDNYIVGVEGFY